MKNNKKIKYKNSIKDHHKAGLHEQPGRTGKNILYACRSEK